MDPQPFNAQHFLWHPLTSICQEMLFVHEIRNWFAAVSCIRLCSCRVNFTITDSVSAMTDTKQIVTTLRINHPIEEMIVNVEKHVRQTNKSYVISVTQDCGMQLKRCTTNHMPPSSFSRLQREHAVVRTLPMPATLHNMVKITTRARGILLAGEVPHGSFRP